MADRYTAMRVSRLTMAAIAEQTAEIQSVAKPIVLELPTGY